MEVNKNLKNTELLCKNNKEKQKKEQCEENARGKNWRNHGHVKNQN